MNQKAAANRFFLGAHPTQKRTPKALVARELGKIIALFFG